MHTCTIPITEGHACKISHGELSKLGLAVQQLGSNCIPGVTGYQSSLNERLCQTFQQSMAHKKFVSLQYNKCYSRHKLVKLSQNDSGTSAQYQMGGTVKQEDRKSLIQLMFGAILCATLTL